MRQQPRAVEETTTYRHQYDDMKAALFLSALTTASALSVPFEANGQKPLAPEERYLIQLNERETRWVTEDEKWELRRQGLRFFDITDNQQPGTSRVQAEEAQIVKVEYPSKPQYNESLAPLLKQLKKGNMREHLETFTGFHTRYYKSDYGRQSSEWLLGQVNKTLEHSNASDAYVRHFPHSWGQNSIIATIPGKSENTVVIGAHQDSINLFLPSILAAPGADDDGSGTVTILEALRVLIQDEKIAAGKQENTIEFHWYSAEEGGLLGSQAIFTAYEAEGRKVKAMLQQDMTGYTHGTIEAGQPESVGVITDYVDAGLTEFIKEVVTEYCDIPYVETKVSGPCDTS